MRDGDGRLQVVDAQVRPMRRKPGRLRVDSTPLGFVRAAPDRKTAGRGQA